MSEKLLVQDVNYRHKRPNDYCMSDEQAVEKTIDKPVVATTDAAATDEVVVEKKKKSKKKHVTRGRAYIQASYNNTIVSFTDQQGNVLTQSSAGHCGFKGPKKSTPYAAGIIVKNAAEKVRDYGLKDIDVYVTGIGSGREGAIRAINAQGFNMLTINDTTPIPHNGCRPKKPRRV